MKISNLIYRCFFVFIAVTGFVSCEDDEELYPQLGDDPRNISEIVSEKKFNIGKQVFRIGIEDKFVNKYGSQQELFSHLGIDAKSIEKIILKKIKK